MHLGAYETYCMSLQHAVLVSLAEHEATGYDLTRRFDKSLGFFWSATHQQMYRVLGQMTDAGLLEVRTEAGQGKPDRRVYSLTDAGRDELRAWTAAPSPLESMRSAFAVKVRGTPFGDADAVLADIEAQREAHAERLAYYEANCAKNFPHPQALGDADRPRYAVLRGGIRIERAWVEWCDEMLDILTPSPSTIASQTPHEEKTP